MLHTRRDPSVQPTITKSKHAESADGAAILYPQLPVMPRPYASAAPVPSIAWLSCSPCAHLTSSAPPAQRQGRLHPGASCRPAAHQPAGVRRQAPTDQCSDHLLWLTTERMEWHRAVPRGNKPAAREGHSCTLHRDRCAICAAPAGELARAQTWSCGLTMHQPASPKGAGTKQQCPDSCAWSPACQQRPLAGPAGRACTLGLDRLPRHSMADPVQGVEGRCGGGTRPLPHARMRSRV